MPGMAILPYIETLSRSQTAFDRSLFVRVFGDYASWLRGRGQSAPRDWLAALERCLSTAEPGERKAYLDVLGELGWLQSAGGLRELRVDPGSDAMASASAGPAISTDSPSPISEAPQDIDRLIEESSLESLLALVSNPRVRLAAEQCAALVARARQIVDATGDSRLARAILASAPIRNEMAPLFLEATSDQRWRLVLAVQRAELGRRPAGAIATIGRETIARLEHAAIAGDLVKFHELLARALGATPQLAARISADPTGEPLAVALAAIGAATDVCVRVLAANDMDERGEFRRLRMLARLSNGLNPIVARRIATAIISGRPSTPTGAPPLPAGAPRQKRGYAEPLRADANAGKAKSSQPRKDSTVGAK